jgi:hypothetical protein
MPVSMLRASTVPAQGETRHNIIQARNGIKEAPFCLLHAVFLLGQLFDPENGGDMYLQNIC